MAVRVILTEYVNQLMAHVVYDKLEDSTFAGQIPQYKGVVAFETTLRECEDELRFTLEDWILVGLKLDHHLPIQRLRKLGFDGPYSGTTHQFMVYGQQRLAIPSNAEYSMPQLRMIIREVEEIMSREITADERNKL